MLDLSPRQIRACVAEGVVEPIVGERGKHLFQFTDLVVLRTVADLQHQGVAPRRIRAAITHLHSDLPDMDLSEVTFDAEGRAVVVRTDTATWEPESGQTVLDFDIREVIEPAIALETDRGRTPEHGVTASSWYAYADEIEDTDPAEAETAYRKAIELEPDFADAHLNLGRLLHAAGAVREALAEYEAAREADDGDATTHYNIGVAAQDLGERSRAVAAYERAIELAPRFADARFNLSALYEAMGETALATQHLREYRDLITERS